MNESREVNIYYGWICDCEYSNVRIVNISTYIDADILQFLDDNKDTIKILTIRYDYVNCDMDDEVLELINNMYLEELKFIGCRLYGMMPILKAFINKIIFRCCYLYDSDIEHVCTLCSNYYNPDFLRNTSIRVHNIINDYAHDETYVDEG